MKAIIFAAGQSKRLRPKTNAIPKTLLPLEEKLILEHILDAIRAAGITVVELLSGHGHEHVQSFIQQYTGAHPELRVNIIFVDRYANAGNIIALPAIEDVFDDDIVIINSDTIFHEDILKALLASSHKNAMVIDDMKTLGEEEMKVLINADDTIYRIHKSLNPQEAHGEYVGILKFSPGIKDQLMSSVKALLLEDDSLYYEDAIQKMIDDYQVTIKRVSTGGLPVMEIDTHEDLAAAKVMSKQI